ncbi:hypothetical protein [Streptomyces sp. NPDC003077]|uniref:hypothetical protein n=1 Tax=Streptomyces sp. NPDC003077 TaxID=3154443 RepID=UPI0033BAC087
MEKVATVTAAAIATTALIVGATTPAQAEPGWNKRVKCQQTDPAGRKIPTRFGNTVLG